MKTRAQYRIEGWQSVPSRPSRAFSPCRRMYANQVPGGWDVYRRTPPVVAGRGDQDKWLFLQFVPTLKD